jgi:CRP-like cAMP-binding protein
MPETVSAQISLGQDGQQGGGQVEKRLSEQAFQILLKSRMFRGMKKEEIQAMLPCLDAVRRHCDKEEWIFRQGETVTRAGVVLSGKANVIREDYFGNRNIIMAILPGDLFAESFALVKDAPINVAVQAAEETEILLLDVGKILRMCSNACEFHARLLENTVGLLAAKNLALNEKLTHVTQHTLRDKILSYLSAEALRHKSEYFDIPFDRQQMASYLGVDRSALSGELSKLRREKILDFQKNHFRLLRGIS